MFYPAAPDALNALIADVRKRARPDGGVAPKVVIAPHAGLVYSGAVAATAFGAWARRAEPPRRIVIIGPAHRVAFSGVAVHPASKWRTPLGEIPVAAVTHAELAQAPGVVVDPRPFAGEHSLEMHLIMLQAMLPAPFEIVPILVGDADPRCGRRGLAPGLGRAGDGRRGLIRPVAFSRSDERAVDRLRHGPAHRDARRRRARWPPRLRLLADQGRARDRRRARHARERPASGDIGGRGRGRVAGRRLRRLRARIRGLGAACRGRSRASAFRLHGRPRRRGADRRQGAARRRSPPVARAFGVARDLRHPDRKRTASRLHRFARAASAADRRCGRQYGASGLCRPALSAAEGVRTRRASPRRLDPLPPAADSAREANPNLRTRSSPTATGSFSRPASGAPCSCRAFGAISPTLARSCAI